MFRTSNVMKLDVGGDWNVGYEKPPHLSTDILVYPRYLCLSLELWQKLAAYCGNVGGLGLPRHICAVCTFLCKSLA